MAKAVGAMSVLHSDEVFVDLTSVSYFVKVILGAPSPCPLRPPPTTEKNSPVLPVGPKAARSGSRKKKAKSQPKSISRQTKSPNLRACAA